MTRTFRVRSDGKAVGGRFPDRHSAVNSDTFQNDTGKITEVVDGSGHVVAIRIAKNIVGYHNYHRMPDDQEAEA